MEAIHPFKTSIIFLSYTRVLVESRVGLVFGSYLCNTKIVIINANMAHSSGAQVAQLVRAHH